MMIPIPRSAACLFTAWLAASASAQPADAPPKARTVDVVDRDFGLTLPDPYRWMEGQDNAEFDAWLAAQGEYARKQLDALPTVATWQQRGMALAKAARINGAYQAAGGRMFFRHREGPQSTGTLMLREADGSERALLDPSCLKSEPDADKGPASIASYAPSPDGHRVAVNLNRGGSEIAYVQVLDVQTATWLPDTVGPVFGNLPVQWLPDGSGFAYTQLAPADEHPADDPLQNPRVRLHKLGTEAGDDPLLLRAGSNPSLPLTGKEDTLVIQFFTGSDWALAQAADTRRSQRLYAAPRNGALKPGTAWRPIADYVDGVLDWALRGNTLYLLSVKDHPNGRLLALDLSRPHVRLADAREVLPESADAVFLGDRLDGVSSLAGARDALYAKHTTPSGADALLRIDYTSGKATPIATPFAGSALGLIGDADADGFFVSLQGWTAPNALYRYDVARATLRDQKLGTESPADYSAIVSNDIEATSADGTHVPLTLIQRRGAPRDGKRLALVSGYGGYGTSLQPAFNPIYLEWAKAGHLYAVCHVRGGGEKGDTWHRAGQGANKHKGVEDYLACAAELARRGYTTPARTGLIAASMGGVLAGGALTSGPDRIGAVVIQAGVLNPVRLLTQVNGATQIPEVGDPRNEDGLKALAAMDPYLHVRDGVAYPAVLLMVGLNDNRVVPWESGKLAARLQLATASGKPVWLRTDTAAGHFAGGSQLAGVAAAYADVFAFLEAQLGNSENP